MHKHHIIPRHMGGTDDPSNIKLVTIEEHAEEHRKLYEQHNMWQDYVAWKALSGQISHEEATLEAIRYTQSNRVRTEAERKHMSLLMTGENNSFYGKKHTDETRQKIIDNHVGNLGKKLDPEWKMKISKSNMGKSRNKGVLKSIEHRQAMSLAAKKLWAARKAGG